MTVVPVAVVVYVGLSRINYRSSRPGPILIFISPNNNLFLFVSTPKKTGPVSKVRLRFDFQVKTNGFSDSWTEQGVSEASEALEAPFEGFGGPCT